jgi:hypothetical protein
MIKIVLVSVIVIVTVFAVNASAQQVIIDWDKAMLTWTWTENPGSVTNGWRMKCGQTSGTYTVITDVADPAARSMSAKTATGGGAYGVWFCVVVPYNNISPKPGEGKPSNVVSFQGGMTPQGIVVLSPPTAATALKAPTAQTQQLKNPLRR